MEEWKEYRLGDILSIKSGFSYKGKYIGTGDSLLLGMGCVSYKEKFLLSGSRPYSGPYDDRYKVYPGDIVLATRQQSDNLPILAMPAMVPESLQGKNIVIGTNLYKVEIIDNSFSNVFIFWLLKTKRYVNYIAGVKTGTTVSMVTKNNVEDFTFYAPSNPKEREKIVSVISSLDDKIEVNRRINEQLEELAQALFKSWFVDFEPFKDGEFVESELGMIPEGWKVGKLGDYCKVKSGYAFKSSWWQDKGLKVIKIKNITSNGELDMNECSYVAPENTLKAKDFETEVGDLLIAMTGATIGKFCMVCFNETMYVNQRVGKFFLGSNPIIRLPFIYCTLKTDRVYSEIVNKGQGSAQPNISGSDIENIRIPMPTNTDYLLLFNEKLKSVFERMINNQQEIILLTTLRDTLLPKLMSGDIAIE